MGGMSDLSPKLSCAVTWAWLGVILFLALGTPSFGQEAPRVLDRWKLTADDRPIYAQTSFSLEGVEELSLPGRVTFPPGGGVRWLLLDLPQEYLKDQPYLLLWRFEAAMQVYFNGVLIAEVGRFPPEYRFATGKSFTVKVPPQLLQPINRVGLRIFRDGDQFLFQPIRLGTHRDALIEETIISFLNEEIYIIFAYLNLFIALFFFFQWLFQPGARFYLWFSLTNLAFFIYFLRVGDDLVWLPFLPTVAITRAFLCVAVYCLFNFYIDLFQVWRSRRLRWVLGLLLGFFFFLQVLYHPDYSTINTNFTLSLLPIQVMIILVIVMTVIAWRRGNREAIIILGGSAWGVGFGTHDIVFMVNGLMPLAWLQGVGIFGFNLSIFFYLAYRASKIQHELDRSREGLKLREAQLTHTLQEIQKLSQDLVAASQSLRNAMEGTRSVINKFGQNTGTIAGAIQRQGEMTVETQRHLAEVIQSVQNVYQSIQAQSDKIVESSRSISQLFQSIRSITDNLEKTSAFTRSLAESIRRSVQMMQESQAAMERIRRGGDSIGEIVETVTELAERTNLLSMNAGIEAAHAGNLGRGFAVVAQEIKKLADSSSSRAREIAALVKDIQQSVQLGVRSTAEVEELLQSIQSQSLSSASQVNDIYEAVLKQKSLADQIQRLIQQLEEAGLSIKNQADAQNRSTKSIGQRIDALVESLREIQKGTADLKQENSRLVESMLNLGQTSNRLAQATENLNALLRGV